MSVTTQATFLTTRQLRKMCGQCAWLLTLLKSLSPRMLGGKWSEPIEIFITVSARVEPDCRENSKSQNPILSAKIAPTCARVRLSFPYYRVRTSALTPDGGLINGVRVLSQGKHQDRLCNLLSYDKIDQMSVNVTDSCAIFH